MHNVSSLIALDIGIAITLILHYFHHVVRISMVSFILVVVDSDHIIFNFIILHNIDLYMQYNALGHKHAWEWPLSLLEELLLNYLKNS